MSLRESEFKLTGHWAGHHTPVILQVVEAEVLATQFRASLGCVRGCLKTNYLTNKNRISISAFLRTLTPPLGTQVPPVGGRPGLPSCRPCSICLLHSGRPAALPLPLFPGCRLRRPMCDVRESRAPVLCALPPICFCRLGSRLLLGWMKLLHKWY